MSEAEKPKTEDVKPDAASAAKPSAAPVTATKRSSKTMWIVIGVLVLLFVILPAILILVVGHKVAKDVTVNTGNNTATIKTNNGDQITTGSQSLPKDFPTSVPVYKGTIVNSSRLTIDGKVNWSVSVESKDDPTKIGDTLSSSFSTNGWTANLDNKTGDGGLISAENGQYHVQVIYVTKDGKTTISYVVVPSTATQ